nr:C-type lectin 37Db-like [Aedes albopictus]
MKLIIFLLFPYVYYVACSNSYIIPNLTANWFQASDHCKSRGMELVSIANQAEYNQLTEFVARELNCTELCAVWIGANDLGSEGTFTWTATGRWVGFTNWKSNQPDNTNGVFEEHCVEVLYFPAYDFIWQWNDSVCKHEKYFACERVKMNNYIPDFDWKN